jgi:hypothetical protein
MSRARLALAAGVLLLVAACLLPCFSFVLDAGSALPYQDPTPEMLAKQAAENAAAERRLAVFAVIGGILAVLGLIALVYAWRHRRSRPVR